MATLIKNRQELLLDETELNIINQETQNQEFSRSSLAFIEANGNVRKLPVEVSELLQCILRTVAENGNVSISSLPSELTSTTAASLLGVSRPTLLKLAQDGKIPSFKNGSHTRFTRNAVLNFKAEREQEKQKILSEILEVEDELDA